MSRTLYNQLTASLQGRFSLGGGGDPPSLPSQDDSTGSAYPKLRFWTQTQYNHWTNSPEAHAETNWKLAYLEDASGVMVSKDTIKAIWKALRAGWTDLVNKGLAPKSWSKICTSARELFHAMIEKSFPIFKLGHNGWKLDYLCATDYPSWVRNNLNEDGKWFASGNKSMKTEEEPEAAGQEMEMVSIANGKRKTKRSTPEGGRKKLKGKCFSLSLQCSNTTYVVDTTDLDASAARDNASSQSPDQVYNDNNLYGPLQSSSVTPTSSTASSTSSPTLAPAVVQVPTTTIVPSIAPSVNPTIVPAVGPAVIPTVIPAVAPSVNPTIVPAVGHAIIPAVVPAVASAGIPAVIPAVRPAVIPPIVPAVASASIPAVVPTVGPAVIPAVAPMSFPTVVPLPSLPNAAPVSSSIAPVSSTVVNPV